MAVTGIGLLAGLALGVSVVRRRPGRERGVHLRQLAVRRTCVRGLTMHARVSVDPVPRDRLPVILVHGLGMSSRYMIPLAQHLAPHVRVYAPDLPGFGRSEKPPRALDVSGLSDALAGWMRAAGLEGATLVGNSFGCQIIADLAVRRPGLVGRAVLQGPTMDPAARSVPQQVGRFLLSVPRDSLSLLPIEFLDYLRAGTGRAWRTFRYALRDRIEDRLPAMRIPVLVVRGSRDPIAPQRWAEEVTRLLPEGRLVVVTGAAHAVNYGSPSRFACAIRAFLESDEEGLG
jgi:2-hydroxy-6-oxonona-2,4-dienedioate hydrolase